MEEEKNTIQEEPKEIKKEGKRQLKKHFVDSSNLEWVAYDDKKKVLYIQFRNGGLYSYDDVPEKEFDSLMAAGSKGRYFAVKIKWNYKYTRLHD